MTWNYRVCKTFIGDEVDGGSEVSYGIHEIYYAEDGAIRFWTESAVAPSGETLHELKIDMLHMVEALAKPVINLERAEPSEDGL